MVRSNRHAVLLFFSRLSSRAQGIVRILSGDCARAAILPITCILFASQAFSADEPGVVLNRAFAAAKFALASGDLSRAERHYDQTIALGLQQLASLSISESRFDEAARELDEALKFAPADPEIAASAASAWFRAGDVKKARELVAAAIAANPRQARAQNIIGRIDLFRGDFDSAIRELQASIAIEDDFETSYFLAIAYLKAKRLTDAQQWFEHLRSTMGDSAALRVLIGRAYSIAHFPELAVVEFRKAIQLDTKYPRAHSLLGYSVLEFRGEEAYPQARVEFQNELKLRPDDYNALLLFGISEVALRDFPAAEAALLHAKRLRPDEPFPYLYLGETFSETNRLTQAVGALQKFIQLANDPDGIPRDLARAYFLLGQSLRRLGRVEEALNALRSSQCYRETKFRYDAQHIFDEPGKLSDGDSHASDRIAGVLESRGTEDRKATDAMVVGGVSEKPPPQRASPAQQLAETSPAKQYRAFASEILASSYNDLGVMRANVSDFKEASEYFKQAARWKPSLPGLDRNWGMACYRAELYAEAIAPLERHLAESPQDAFVRQLLGLSYFATDNFAKTAEVLRPFLNNPPNDPGLLFAWGTSLVRTRQTGPAMGIFRRLLEQNAANPAVHLLLGQAYAQQKNYVSALGEFNRAVELEPRLSEARYYRGLVYLREGDFESAASEFRSELEIRPEDPITGYHLGYALLLQGQTAAATTILRKVVEATPEYEAAQFELGRALLQSGDFAGAIERLEAAKKLLPDRDATYFQLSQAYRRVGHLREAEQALAVYQKLIEGKRSTRRENLEANDP